MRGSIGSLCHICQLLPFSVSTVIANISPMPLAATMMERRRQAAIEEIAAVALDLILRDGFEATSVEAIAAAAGCAPRTFYRYFATKEDVLFHDVPVFIERLAEVLEKHLADGLGPWAAASEVVVDYISQFDATDERRRIPTERMNLWMSEPALLARYMQYVNQGEQMIAEVLHRHRGTIPERDDLPQLVAVAAVGAARVTLLTHSRASSRKLTKHLRDALGTFGAGLADEKTAGRSKRAGRST
jgi:AcrR family transcriptional regulator